jgi:hypothetical protein
MAASKELSPRDLFLQALHQKVGYEVVQLTEGPNQLRVMGRIPPDPLSLNLNNWVILRYRLHKAMESRPWTIDTSRADFIKKETDKLVYAWRIILQAPGGLASHYPDLLQLVQTSPRSSRTEVTEIPLSGRADNSTTGGKRGAGPAGSVLVGPMAVHAKRMGG